MPLPSSAPVVGGLIVAGDRQGYLMASLLSQRLVARVHRDVLVIVDTSQNGLTRANARLANRCAGRVEVIRAEGASLHRAVRLGAAALVEEGVDVALAVEEDFVVASGTAARRALALATERSCLQVCLVRQRWFAAEFGHPTMGDYLVDRRGGRREDDRLIAIDGFFTTNPSAFVPSVLHRVLADVEPSDAYDFELAVGDSARRHELPTLVIDARVPPVVHVGAVSTSRLRARRGPRALVYLTVHTSRAATVTGRLLRERIRPRVKA